MEKRRQGKKRMLDADMSSSFSSFSSSESESESESSSLNEIPVEIQDKEQTSIMDLPLEMLMNLLKLVDTRSLFACRRVNRQWSEMSSEILRSHPQSKIQFAFYEKIKPGCLELTRKKVKRGLLNFLECFKESKNCPFAHFYFEINTDLSRTLTFFEDKNWTEFLLHFNASRVKSLKLKFEFPPASTSFDKLIEQLNDLLLNKIPHLEEFGLKTCSAYENTYHPLEYSPTTTSKSKLAKFSDLKVVHLDSSSFSNHPGIFHHLLTAAVNLKRIVPFCHGDKFQLCALKFPLLHSLGKIPCLQNAHIALSPELLDTVRETSNSPLPPPFKLETLDLCVYSVLESSDSWSDASSFISSLFESCKTTLVSLTMPSLGFLPNFQLPTFKNVMDLELTLSLDNVSWEPQQFFPHGIKPADIFPAVRFLDVDVQNYDWEDAFPLEKYTPRLENVESLTVLDYGIRASCIFKMALLCPYLKKFKITENPDLDHYYDSDSPATNFAKVVQAVWSHMKELEALEIFRKVDVDEDAEEDGRFALDSCFTGIPEENCKRIYEVAEAVKTLKKWAFKFQIHEQEPEPERKYPSILDMKDLKQLTVHPRGFFKNNLTWVSQKYAFKLMPQLKISK